MITVGSYWYLRGTNFEVGIRHLSADKKTALVAFRNGKRAGVRLTPKDKRNSAIRIITEEVPTECLTETSTFTKRGKLKSEFAPVLPLDSEKATPMVEFPRPGKYYNIWGLKEMFYKVKDYNRKTKVLTFAVTPIRRAHVSVIRHGITQTPVWGSARISPLHNHAPVEIGYIPGTTIPVHVLIEDEPISLYKISIEFGMWIPNELLGVECCEGKLPPEDLTSIGTVYLHGFIPVEAKQGEDDDHVFVLIDKIYRTVDKSVIKPKDPDMAHLENYRKEEREEYMCDYYERLTQPDKLRSVAVC